MRKLRLAGTAALLGVSTVLALVPSLSGGAEGDSSPDSITPIASSIQSIDNVDLAIGPDRKLVVSLPYARQGAIIFALPVWVVQGTPELRTGSGVDSHPCSPDAVLLRASDPLPLRLRVRVANLLAGEQSRKAVQSRLREEIAATTGQKAEALHFEPPLIDRNGFRVTLCASGSGEQAEVLLSQTSRVPPAVVQGGGEIDLELVPAAVAAWQGDKGRPLTLTDTYLKFEGSLKAHFETEQYRANFVAVSQAVTGLQNRVRSIAPSAREAPVAVVHVPVGGEVSQDSGASAVFRQALVGTISVRSGENLDLGAIQQLTDRVLQSLLQQLQAASFQDGQRVAFLLGRQVTVSATVGEIRTLAKQTRAEREQQLKEALDDWQARHNGQESDYKGSLGVDVHVPVLPVSVGANVSGEMQKKVQEDQARRRREAMETLHKGLDEVKDHFEGKVPTLTGIQFDQKSLSATLGQVAGELTQSRFTVGWSHYESPPVRPTNLTAEVFDAQSLAEQVAEARARYAALKELLKDDRRLQELVEAARKVEALEKRLKEQEKQLQEREEEARKVRREAEAFVKRWAEKIPLSERISVLTILRGHTRGVTSVCFSPDGKRLASASFDQTVKVWDAQTGQEALSLQGHTDAVYSVCFSPDGQRLASASLDGTVKVWDAQTGQQALSLKGHTGFVYSVCFSPDGQRLASASADKTVKVWEFTGVPELPPLQGARETRDTSP